MKPWLSRGIAIVFLSAIFALATSLFDKQRLAWLNAASPSDVVAIYRKIHDHGYLYQFVNSVFAFAVLVAAVEIVAWGIRKIVSPLSAEQRAARTD